MAKETVASQLRALISGGVATPLAIGVATSISEKEIALILVERIEPTKEQEERLEKLLKNYQLAGKLVNGGDGDESENQPSLICWSTLPLVVMVATKLL